MTRYEIDSDALVSTAAAVRGAIGRVQAEMAALHGQLTSLQGSWTGQASSAFQTLLAEWRATELRVEEHLSALNQAVALAGAQYAEVELQNARMFRL